MTDWNRCGRKAGEFGAFSSFGAPCGGALCSQLPDARIVAAHSCWEDGLCSFSCSCGELANVKATKKASRTLMLTCAHAFIVGETLLKLFRVQDFFSGVGSEVLPIGRATLSLRGIRAAFSRTRRSRIIQKS